MYQQHSEPFVYFERSVRNPTNWRALVLIIDSKVKSFWIWWNGTRSLQSVSRCIDLGPISNATIFLTTNSRNIRNDPMNVHVHRVSCQLKHFSITLDHVVHLKRTIFKSCTLIATCTNLISYAVLNWRKSCYSIKVCDYFLFSSMI